MQLPADVVSIDSKFAEIIDSYFILNDFFFKFEDKLFRNIFETGIASFSLLAV